jgi:flagellar protein FlaG
MNISDINRAVPVQGYTPPVARSEKSARETANQAAVAPLVRSDGSGAPTGAIGNRTQPVTPVQDARMEAQNSQNAQTPREALQSALDKVEKFISVAASDIEFSIDEESGTTVVKIVDRDSKEVIRQIPSEEMLELSRALDRLQGLFIKNKA